MKFLIYRNGCFYFNRRVPDLVKEYDPRKHIRISLKTDSKEIAKQRAITLNKTIESYWNSLIQSGETYHSKDFKNTIKLAKQMGFSYATSPIISQYPLEDIKKRLYAVESGNQAQVKAVLGGVEKPQTTLNDALEIYWKYTKDLISSKTDDQKRKWENPRKKAVRNFVNLIGNKALIDIARDDIISFRDWWSDRVQIEDKNVSSANKDFIHLKSVIEIVSDNLRLEIDTPYLFKKIMFKPRHEQTRLPFETKQIIDILHNPLLNKLNDDAKWFLFAASETGARPSELLGLLPEDIKLEAKIPHISIIDRKNRPLKTPHSQRDIPLIGYALEAFKMMPKGFSRYRDKSDSLSALLNKFLRDNHLFPSEKHSVYSFRHSFQDRILSVDMPDRIQAELMGHKFKRPRYGDGATLEHKQLWLHKICIKQ